jgi:hypothetical protein
METAGTKVNFVLATSETGPQTIVAKQKPPGAELEA